MKDIVIFGAGGFGMEVAWLIEEINKVQPTWNLLGYLDDTEHKCGSVAYGYKVLGPRDFLAQRDEPLSVAIAVGESEGRRQLSEELSSPNLSFPSLLHPSVQLSKSVRLGEGTLVAAGSILTVEIHVGRHVHINLDCTVGHGASLGDFVTLFPSVNVSGDVAIGTGSMIGTGASIIQRVAIGANTVVGAGAVVVDDLPDHVVAVGVPARIIRKIEGRR